MKRLVLIVAALFAVLVVSSCKKQDEVSIKMTDINIKVGEAFSPFNFIEVCNDSDGIVSLSKKENWKFNFEGDSSPMGSGERYYFNEPGTGTCYAVYSDGALEIISNVSNVTVKK